MSSPEGAGSIESKRDHARPTQTKCAGSTPGGDDNVTAEFENARGPEVTVSFHMLLRSNDFKLTIP